MNTVEPDPMPYTASDGRWRSSMPFMLAHGPLSGTGAAPLGWAEHSVYAPRWFTDDQYAEHLEHELSEARS